MTETELEKLRRRFCKLQAEKEELKEQKQELKQRLYCKRQFVEGLETENEALRLLIEELEEG